MKKRVEEMEKDVSDHKECKMKFKKSEHKEMELFKEIENSRIKLEATEKILNPALKEITLLNVRLNKFNLKIFRIE